MIDKLRSAPTIIALSLAFVAADVRAAGGVVVIGNANVTSLDRSTLQRIYNGKAIQANGVSVTAVNWNIGSPLRGRFLQSFLNEDDEKYRADWIARTYAGLGAPPRELSSASAIISYVKSTPGAIAYIDEAELEPGVNVLLKP